MGSLSGNLATIVLGAGLGILAISCLTVTICFGRYANSLPALVKLYFKIDLNGSKEAYDCAVAIAVLGCLSFVAALAALALSIVMDGQTMILIIVGGVASVFAFGCIVAEGVYTSKAIKIYSFDDIKEVPKKEDAQKYITNAINDFYKKLTEVFQSDDGDELSTYFSNGNPDELWGGSSNVQNNNQYESCREDDFNKFFYDANRRTIYACTKQGYDPNHYINYGRAYAIALTEFYSKDKYSPKYRVCKYNSDRTNYKCKVVKGEGEDYEHYGECNMMDYSITQYINGEIVSNFPVAYSTDFDEEKESRYYKISAKDCTKADLKDGKKTPSKYSDYFFWSDREFNNMNDYFSYCYNEYGENERCGSGDFDQFREIFEEDYEGKDEGKKPSVVKNYYKAKAKHDLVTDWNDFGALYNLALANLIIQIFAIIFWAVGRFLGNALGGSGDNAKSEGEA